MEKLIARNKKNEIIEFEVHKNGVCDCSFNNLIEIISIPNTVITLTCWGNSLTKLPTLPQSLISLYCQRNKLKSLPTLPNTLKNLYSYDNQITKLPKILPQTLKYIDVAKNKLKEIYQELPINILSLNISNNDIYHFPNFKKYKRLRTLIMDKYISIPLDEYEKLINLKKIFEEIKHSL